MQDKTMEQIYDLVVIGGGINGTGCAQEAATRGLKVCLFEQQDIASQTSSKSTKLIHGGLRYLEYFEFKLVRKALIERTVLLQVAPHLVSPLLFVLPLRKGLRSVFLLKIGLFIYDHLTKKNILPSAKFLRSFAAPVYFKPLKKQYQKCFTYYDCKTNDARLTVCIALQAQKYGAKIYNYTKVDKITNNNKTWHIEYMHNGAIKTIQTKVLINATGPWVNDLEKLMGVTPTKKITLVKGSHLVVTKIFEGEHAYILQHDDKRVIFAIPYHNNTLIGTTDIKYEGEITNLKISDEETKYLIDIANNFFEKPISSNDIINSWSGVRPIVAEHDGKAQELSRDYNFVLQKNPLPFISIYGGKITTYRELALEVIDSLGDIFSNLKPSKSKVLPLPGASLNKINYKDYLKFSQHKYHWLPDIILQHYLETYGTLTEEILKNAHKTADLGRKFSKKLYQVEIDYLTEHEWAKTLDDIIWRRTNLGYELNNQEKVSVKDYLLSVFN